ncbi:OLC1v1002994C1 [Oldenlandia corymbosa var. corymbosa]|uniref:OLC1v1002994C1 n=1 Tax=Oldenlandia corymbosa var. corymbosa TaxID=529605 RepID=A0AAV1D9T8_OLDCO|nr:OLC1v1002994C1 [Oldenlandia corymbosa var. corymbosa]
MACLNMYNNDQQGGIHSTMGPRISFSNDFADSQYPIKHENSYREAPVSSDFEFSVSGYNMIPADEVFFKGKLMPTKNSATKTTIRDELLADDDDDLTDGASPRVTKGMSRWKERLGLKRSHIHHVPRKSFDKINVPHELVLESIDETATTFSFGEH